MLSASAFFKTGQIQKSRHKAKPPNITDWEKVPVVFDIPMASRILGSSPEHVQRQCKRGELPAFKYGKLWRFKKEEFLEYIRELCEKGT